MMTGYRPGREMGMHYREAIKAEVVPNFRLLGVWQSPYADGSYDGQDVLCWMVPMVEGLMTVYLGPYIRKHIVTHWPDLLPLSLYDLIKRIRDGISLLQLLI